MSDSKPTPAKEVTAETLRKNLRLMRHLHGWTLEQVISKINDTDLNATLLGRIETGSRKLQATELFELAVAYQVPPQFFACPWPVNTSDDFTPQPEGVLTGADHSCTPKALHDWLLMRQYPDCNEAPIARYGAALEGQLKDKVLHDFDALASLYNSPNPSLFANLLCDQLDDLIRPLIQAVDFFRAKVEDLLLIDPFPFLIDYTPRENSTDPFPQTLLKLMFHETPEEALTSSIYSTIDDLWKDVEQCEKELRAAYEHDLQNVTFPMLSAQFTSSIQRAMKIKDALPALKDCIEAVIATKQST